MTKSINEDRGGDSVPPYTHGDLSEFKSQRWSCRCTFILAKMVT